MAMIGSTPYLEQGVEDRHASSDQVHTPAVCDFDVIFSYQVTENMTCIITQHKQQTSVASQTIQGLLLTLQTGRYSDHLSMVYTRHYHRSTLATNIYRDTIWKVCKDQHTSSEHLPVVNRISTSCTFTIFID